MPLLTSPDCDASAHVVCPPEPRICLPLRLCSIPLLLCPLDPFACCNPIREVIRVGNAPKRDGRDAHCIGVQDEQATVPDDAPDFERSDLFHHAHSPLFTINAKSHNGFLLAAMTMCAL